MSMVPALIGVVEVATSALVSSAVVKGIYDTAKSVIADVYSAPDQPGSDIESEIFERRIELERLESEVEQLHTKIEALVTRSETAR